LNLRHVTWRPFEPSRQTQAFCWAGETPSPDVSDSTR
jgi:hypothetical protein